MRLIDADNLHLNLWVPSKNNAIVKAFENSMIDALDRQPTVEAIPIEWIEKWVETDRNSKRRTPYYYKRLFRSRLKMMLEDWEKENEGSNM